MPEQAMCYVGIKPCGCMVAAIVDKLDYRKDTNREVAKWLRSGLTIERRTVEEVREQLHTCKCDKSEKKQE